MRTFAISILVGFGTILAYGVVTMDEQARLVVVGVALGVVATCISILMAGWVMRQRQPRPQVEDRPQPRALGEEPPRVVIIQPGQLAETERRITRRW